MPGAVQVKLAAGAMPLYDAATGYGFVAQTGALPARPVHTAGIRSEAGGIAISEPVFDAEKGFEKDDDSYANCHPANKIDGTHIRESLARQYARMVATELACVGAGYAAKVKEAYEPGVIRSEAGIARGRMVDGRLLEPKALATRARAAKALYFMWVLAQAPKAQSDS